MASGLPSPASSRSRAASSSGNELQEAGGTASFVVALQSQPTSPVIVPVASSDPTEGTVAASTLTFTAVDWNVPQGVTVTGADDAVVVGGFSKRYAMTGWRLGYLVVPERYVRQVQAMQQNLFISPSDFGQWAALEALDATAEVEEMRRRFAPEVHAA